MSMKPVGTPAPAAAGGSGDVVGPASSTDNAIAVYDGTTGELLKDSLVTVSAGGALTLPAAAQVNFGEGTLNYFTYVNAVGPRWSDDTTGFRITHNIQSLAGNRTATWPDGNGTVVVGTAVSATVGANGAAAALTALPLGYLTITLPDGSPAKIPYYNV